MASGNGSDQRTVPGDGGRYRVDAGGAMGVQVGEGNTQIIYAYGRQTWADGVVPPPLSTVTGVVDSPYRGLSTFEERDAAFFFGREAAATQVLARMSRQLDGTGLLVVSGVSGAGKSSLLRAGVLPRLRGTGLVSAWGAASWPCLLFTPAQAPLEELAVRVAQLAGADAAAVRRGLDADPAGFALTARQAALAQVGTPAGAPKAPEGQAEHLPRLLLVVDQFEQLFTQCVDEEERRAFITALHAAATVRHGPDHEPAALVVLGVRADFEARCADYPQLAGAVQDRYLVTAMTERQLRLAIAEPAKKAGSSVDDALTDELLREVLARHPGASSVGVLPLLSHALDQAWRSRTGETLTLADYERTGGIEGGVAESAQRAYDRLTPAQQTTAQQVFTRLTACTDGTDTADRAARAELTEGKDASQAGDVEAVLEAFAAERLIILAAGTVEICHEILLTSWPLLRDVWLAETHADRIVRTRLDNVAAEWARNSQDPTYLYSGSLLATGTETAARIGADPARYAPLSQVERDFLRASDRAYRRRAHRREGIIAFLMALVVGLALLAVATSHAQQDASRQQAVAASGQLINESEAVGNVNPTMSKLLGLAAWRIYPSSNARYAMLAAAASPGIAGLTGHTDRVHSMAFSPNGQILVSGSYDGTVRLWDVASHKLIGKPLSGHDGKIYSVAFSPDGRTLAAGDADGTVWLWNLTTQTRIRSWSTSSSIFDLAFSPDGTMLATGNLDDTAQLWDVVTRQPIGNPLIGYSLAFSPDGKILATGGYDHVVRLWDMVSRTGLAVLTGPIQGVMSVAYGQDGNILAGGGADGAVRLWNAATRQPTGPPLNGYDGAVYSVAFSPNGATLASGNKDGTIRLWNAATRHPIGAPLNRHGGAVYSVAFSRNGTTLASGNADGTVRLWNTATGQPVGPPLGGHTGPVYSVAFSRNGKILASGGADGTVRLWDVANHLQMGKPLGGQAGPVLSVAFSPNGKVVASGGTDDTVRLWKVATHRQIGTALSGHADWVRSVAFSRNGSILATGSADGTVRLWDMATHQQIGDPLSVDAAHVLSVAFSPDGRTVTSAGSDGKVRLWDVAYLVGTAAHLCASAQRSLTPAEWAQYVPPGPEYQSVCP